MTDVKDTVFLPQTDFPLRAGLAQKEPEILKHWQETGLSDKLKAVNAGKTPFVLHDGPPFANGAMHLGHAMNKILKDVVNRSKRMSGYQVQFVPGWDCHGLPIEWKIEQDFRAKGRTKDQVPVPEMIGACRAFAAEWVDVQREGIKRLGVDASWETPYLTMAKTSEAAIVAEVHKFLMAGLLYRADRPVMWSVVEQTSLAEAEIEYHDHKSTSLWVRFPVRSSPLPILDGVSVVIWTTTPWTLPANQAIAYGDKIEYAVYEVKEVAEGSPAKVGERMLLARALAESTQKAAKIVALDEIASIMGSDLAGTIAAHPLADQGYGEDRPLWAGDFVTTDAGTGFVHIAPSHGEDDFRLGQKMGVALVHRVGGDGVYYDSVPLFAGKRVLTEEGKEGDANVAVIKAIAAAGGLLAKATITHSYPHSWRSKAPVIFRTTPQWFVALDKPLAHLNGQSIRQRALEEIKTKVRWIPPQGQNRIYAMIEGRYDWCLSRQRMWGVPLALFINKATGEPLMDASVNARIAEIFAQEGMEAWHSRPAQDFLGTAYKAEDFEQIFDTADVWFDSASTHAFVLEQREGLTWPADLYLEGSDQHRGWFQSSLLEAVGTRGKAPYKAVLTHGFLLDEKGYKQSKSLGNGIDPADVIKDYGADVLRLALVNCDSRNDVSIGPNIIKQQSEQYRRLRNTLRYLLGALAGFSDAECVTHSEMPALERWVLHRLTEIDAELKDALEAYDFNRYFRTIHDFCAVDLSAFYFDVRKDSLYCDAKEAATRRAARSVMEQLFLCLTAWLAPILCFTAEEAWHHWTGNKDDSVHLRQFPVLPIAWQNTALGQRMVTVRSVRSLATTALEVKRSEGVLRSSLEAAVTLHLPEDSLAALDDVNMADICITSACAILPAEDAKADVTVAEGQKCERCWKVLPEVGTSAAHPTLCLRCEAVVK